jgi:hypothetical protein
VIAALGIVFAKGAHADVKTQRDQAFAEVRRLNEVIQNGQAEFLPVLTSSNKALEETAAVVKALQERERAALVEMAAVTKILQDRERRGVRGEG